MWRVVVGFAPELAPSAQGFLAQLQRQVIPNSESAAVSGASPITSDNLDTSKRLTREEFYENNIAELEDAADKESNAAFRSVAYVDAVLATKPEDYVHAKRIAGKIDDDDLRADTLSFALYRAALFFVQQDDLEKAIEIAPTISDVRRRAVVKVAIAQRLLSEKSKEDEPGVANFAYQRALSLLVDRVWEVSRPQARLLPDP
jgi:hypothetical protein